MANIWQVVVVRRDLNMTPGLMAAQVAHINDGWMREALASENGYEYSVEQAEWAQEPYLNVLAVDNKEELLMVIEKAKNANLPVYEWKDVIPSENLKCNMEDVLVGCSVGPADFDKLRLVTGTLPRA
jgi:peptidyl-tRNA hydrolase